MARATASKRNDRPIWADSQPETVESQSAHPTWEEIAGLAYSFWEARGYQGGFPEEDWFRAVQQWAQPRNGEKPTSSIEGRKGWGVASLQSTTDTIPQ
jgi:hypothetical protein